LTRRQWQVLGLAALAALFGAYDGALLPLALPQIQAEFALPDTAVSQWVAIIRLGAVPAFLLALMADGVGRRRLFLGSLILFSLLTAATAFAPNAAFFALCQFLLRTFTAATGLLAGVIIVEEFPKEVRGWGIGAYTALASIGGGLAAMTFALVEVLPFGWRTLFFSGALALLASSVIARNLPETIRFQSQQRQRGQGSTVRRLADPVRRLVHAYPGRFLLLVGVVCLYNLGGDAALFYDPAYLQQAHGWLPWQVSLLNLSAGFMAFIGSAAAGTWSDRLGRRRVTALFLTGMPLTIFVYYHVAGWLLPLSWAAMLFIGIGAAVALNTLATELFPTSYRSTATGAIAVIATLSGALSLMVHGWLLPLIGSPWRAAGLLALLILTTPLLVLLLPETAGRTLEEIAPESAEG
jgi:MFS family permease